MQLKRKLTCSFFTLQPSFVISGMDPSDQAWPFGEGWQDQVPGGDLSLLSPHQGACACLKNLCPDELFTRRSSERLVLSTCVLIWQQFQDVVLNHTELVVYSELI